MSGLKLAASFGFYPHQLGFCGLQGYSIKKTIFDYLSGKKVPQQKIRKILETFIGAFSYYKLIARSNGIKDPFAEKVVKAYWLGNELLEKVSSHSLKEMIIKDFVGRGLLSKETAENKAKKIPLDSKAHHSFHVFIIGSVSGRVALEGKLLDLCRVGWGKVTEIQKRGKKGVNEVIIEYQPLSKRKNKYFLGKPTSKSIFWNEKIIPKIKIGDKVATHWNHIARIISEKDLDNLKKYTWITINSLCI